MINVNSIKTKKFVILSLSVIALVLAGLNANKAFAQDEKCYGAYGEEIPCPVINKSFNIQKAVIKDGALYEEVRGLTAGSIVNFNLAVKNTGELNGAMITVVDNLPSNLTFVSLSKDGKDVNVKVDNNSVSWTIEKFDAGNEYNYVLKAKVNADGIKEGSEKCVTNIGSIFYKGKPEGSDTASVCIKKGAVLGEKTPKQLPETADELPITLGFAVVSVILGALLFTASKLAEERVK